MDKLTIYVCENFFPEYQQIIKMLGFDDIFVEPYPCMCEDKTRKAETKQLLHNSIDNGDDAIIFCNRYCDIVKMIETAWPFEIHMTDYCFNHLANKAFLDYIIQRGGYIIGSGWVNSWQNHLTRSGFDQEIAKKFYHECCNELVIFDAGFDQNLEARTKELAEYLDLPYVIIPLDLSSLEIMVKSAVYEWKLHKTSTRYERSIAELQTQCAEYSAIFDLMGKIAGYSDKRTVIEKVKEIFIFIFGAENFKYWNNNYQPESLSEEIKDLFFDNTNNFFLLKDENRFCIKIQWNNKVYGAFDVSGFLFPAYIEKYLNFAIEIVRVCGLVFSNNEQYEKILQSEQKLQYLGYHDALTGLKNRAYINDLLEKQPRANNITVFMFDIDKLKYVNDNFGHLEGDKLISSAADILTKCFRESDTVARIGGDEFLAVLPQTNRNTATMIKQRIDQEIQHSNNNLQEKHLQISISIGFVSAENEENIEQLIHQADELMYEDKKSKRRL